MDGEPKIFKKILSKIGLEEKKTLLKQRKEITTDNFRENKLWNKGIYKWITLSKLKTIELK